MIDFRELNIYPVNEILKIRCHIYILMKNDYFKENIGGNEVFRSTIEIN